MTNISTSAETSQYGNLLLLPDRSFLCFTLCLKMFNRDYLRDVIGLSAHWLGCKRRVAPLQSTVQYGGRRQYCGGAMQM